MKTPGNRKVAEPGQPQETGASVSAEPMGVSAPVRVLVITEGDEEDGAQEAWECEVPGHEPVSMVAERWAVAHDAEDKMVLLMDDTGEFLEEWETVFRLDGRAKEAGDEVLVLLAVAVLVSVEVL